MLRFVGLGCNVLLFTAAIVAAEAPKMNFDVPADSSEKALRQFSAQAGLEVLFPSDVARGVRTMPVKGEMSPIVY